MPQGSKCTKLGGARKGVKPQKGGKKSHVAKAHSKKKAAATARYKGLAKPKTQAGIEAFKNGQTITKKINANIEKVMAAKVVQAGERLNMRDILSVGKDHSKELKRAALKKKKPRVEEKMEKFREKLNKVAGPAEDEPSAKRRKV